MLALALAESAQQASTQSLKRPGTSQAGYTNYGDIVVATTEDNLPSSYSAVALDKAYFQTDRPAEQFHLQNNAPGNCDHPLPETTAVGDPTHSNTTESGEQYHQVDLTGNQPHQTYLSGDPEKARITSVPLDSEKSDDLISFPEDQSGKNSMPAISFLDQDQSPPRFYSGDHPPSYLGASVDKPHHPLEFADKSPTPPNLPRDKIFLPSGSLADKSPTPPNLPRDKIYPPSGSPEENTSTATITYMTTIPATAQMSTKEVSWDVAEQPTTADFAAATLQRTHRTNRPLPPPPSQRSAEQPPVVGQVQAATNIGLNNSHKVRRGRYQ